MKNKQEMVRKLTEAQSLIDDCLRELSASPSGRAMLQSTEKKDTTQVGTSLDFSKPLRAFMKKYSNGMSGPKKFTLMVARLAKGDASKVIDLAQVEKEWSKMKSILKGKFNRFYSGQAKDRDWVESPKNGKYVLRPSWKEIC